MEQQAQAKIQNALETLAIDLDKNCFRKIDRDVHLCQAKCAEDPTTSMQAMTACQQNCMASLQAVHSYTHKEIQGFQERMMRGVQVCQDNVRSKITADLSEKQITVYRNEAEVCSMKAIDTHLSQLPGLRDTIVANIKKSV